MKPGNEIPTTGQKHCPGCGETKHVLAFAVQTDNVDGLHHLCRECESVKNSKRYIDKVRREKQQMNKKTKKALHKLANYFGAVAKGEQYRRSGCCLLCGSENG